MISKFLKTVVAIGVLCISALMADAQQTNLLGPGTNAANYLPYYSTSNYYNLPAAQILTADAFGTALGSQSTNIYYTNGVAGLGTNALTGAQVPFIGAPLSLNLAYSYYGQLTNAAFLPGTNCTVTASFDASTGFGDWNSAVLPNLSGVMNTNGVITSLGTNVNVGGYTLFRLNHIFYSAPGIGTIVLGGTNVNVAYSTKRGL